MSDTPRETLIAALEGVVKGRMPETHNILRILHHGYAVTRETLQYNASGRVCLRAYHLETTDKGEALLEALDR